jgi:hypothetical protein
MIRIRHFCHETLKTVFEVVLLDNGNTFNDSLTHGHYQLVWGIGKTGYR